VPEWRSTFVENGYALACRPESPQSIAAALRRLLEEPSLRRRMGEKGRQRILDEWHYERAFAPVLAALNADVEETPQPLHHDSAHAAAVRHANTQASK
jgi:glycosyltransferase involved in cell wall biosynthesis